MNELKTLDGLGTAEVRAALEDALSKAGGVE